MTCLYSAPEDTHVSRHREQQWSPRGSPGLWDNSCQNEDYGLVANKRRSYSFTSGKTLVSLSLPEGGTTASGPLIPEGRCDAAPASTPSHIPLPGLQPPTRGELWGTGSICWYPALPADCSLLQPPTRGSLQWLCPRNPWRLGAATRSRCTLGSKHPLCPEHAATPLWPGQGPHRTCWGRRPLAPLAQRTNPSSRSSLGRRSEPQPMGRKALACP